MPSYNLLKYFIIFVSIVICNYDLLGYQTNEWDDITNISNINSKGNDYAPNFNYRFNILYFNSDYEGKSIFYSSQLLKENVFEDRKFYKSPINNSSENQSYLTFSGDNELYLCKYKSYSKQSYLNIFKSISVKNNWSEPIVVDSLAYEGFCAQPTISPDGNMMVFSSDRDSRFGDTDLWMSFKNENGNWGSPIIIKELNSYGNEITPYLHGSDTLYFASDGFEGPGGFDIYISIRSDDKWNRPFPMSHINTDFNESDFVIINNNFAVFASDRPGGAGKLDLYSANRSNTNRNLISRNSNEISLQTQVSNIIIQKNSKIKRFPSFHFFVKKTFERNFSNGEYIIDSLLSNYHKSILDYLINHPEEILVVDSTEVNDNLVSYFISSGVSRNRIEFQKPFDKSDFIKCRLLSGNSLPLIELSTDTYESKPPVIEISIDSRDILNIVSHKLFWQVLNTKNEVIINDTKIPFRDLIILDDFGKELFLADSIDVTYEASINNNIKYNKSRTIYISRQHIKENYIYTKDQLKYEEFYFLVPDNIFFSSDYFQSEYFHYLMSTLNNCKSISLVYFDPLMQSHTSKIKELINQKQNNKKLSISIQKENYSENRIFSKDVASLLIKVIIVR